MNVTHTDNNQCYQPKYKDLTQVDQELDTSLKELSRIKSPAVPKDEKVNSIMSKVSKFEYYAKQHRNVGRSQFYTNNESEISPKVFSSNSLTVNTPAKDVLGGKAIPNYMKGHVVISENNTVDPKSCSYSNVAIRNNTKIGDLVKNFDEKLPKKVNNDVMNDNLYGRINTDKNNIDRTEAIDYRNETKYQEYSRSQERQNEISRSYKDTSFEISRGNQDSRNHDYNRTKAEFLRNNQGTKNQEFARINQDISLSNRENDLSRSYQGTSNLEFSRSQDRQTESSRSHEQGSEMFRSQDKHTEDSSNNGDVYRSQSQNTEVSRSYSQHTEGFRSQDRHRDSSRSREKHTEGSRSNQEARSPLNGIGVPQYSPVYVNQYERAESMRVKVCLHYVAIFLLLYK